MPTSGLRILDAGQCVMYCSTLKNDLLSASILCQFLNTLASSTLIVENRVLPACLGLEDTDSKGQLRI